MCAGVGVEAGIRQHKALHRLSTDDVGFHDLIDIGLAHVSIPDLLGIDHNIWAMLALIEAARLVGTHLAFEAALRELLLKQLLQLRLAFGIATTSRISRRPLVAAYKNVLLKLWHYHILT